MRGFVGFVVGLVLALLVTLPLGHGIAGAAVPIGVFAVLFGLIVSYVLSPGSSKSPVKTSPKKTRRERKSARVITAASAALTEDQQLVMQAVQRAGQEGLTRAHIESQTGLSTGTVGSALVALQFRIMTTTRGGTTRYVVRHQ